MIPESNHEMNSPLEEQTKIAHFETLDVEQLRALIQASVAELATIMVEM